MSYAKELTRIVKDDWGALSFGGDEVDGFTVVDVVDHGSGRWTQHEEIVVSAPDGTYLSYDLERGLTEYQEHEAHADSVRAVLKTTKQVTVTEWVKA